MVPSPKKKNLRHIKRTVETNRVLLPGSPPRKRRKRKPSPKLAPCCFMPGAGPSSAPEAEACLVPEADPGSKPPVPEAGPPSSGPPVPEAGPSSEPEAGPSYDQPMVLFVKSDDSVTIEYIDEGTGDLLDERAFNMVGAEWNHDEPSTPEIQKRHTVTGIDDTAQMPDESIQIESDDDLCFDDETEPLQTIRNASAYPASTTDYTDFEIQFLETEDAINDSALRSIAPDNAYDFNWCKEEAAFQGRQEIFTGTPGPTIDMTDQTSILDVFYEMIDVEFIDMLCTQTNLNARQKIDLLQSQNKLPSRSRLRTWKPTDRDEMLTFLAVLILQGLYPAAEEELYFKFNGFGTMPYFRAIMTYDRFLLLKSMLHFANNDTTDKKTKLWKIDPVTEYFNKKFSSLYYPSKEIVVDESLLKWHGRLSFSQKISTKAAQVGVKTYELCESSSGYLWKFIVYAGKDTQTDRPTRNTTPTTDQQTDDTTDQTEEEPEDDASGRLVATGLETDNSEIRPSNATALIVYQLVEPLLYHGHTLIMDNFYNSPLLARCLKRQKTDIYGTLRLNRQFVPDSLKTLTKTDLRQGEVLVSYCSDLSIMVWRDTNNLVSMISTYHLLRVGTAPNKCKLTYKPNIVLEYNKSMGGVDRKDQFLSAHPMERGRNRVWYKKLFRRLYNAAIFNCFVIFGTKNPNIPHRRFRTLLAEDLLKVHRRLDLTTMTMPMVKKKGSAGSRCIVEDDHFPERTGTQYTRCWLCARANVPRRTPWRCRQCQRNLCIIGCFRDYHKDKSLQDQTPDTF